jgi:hypothetical protein
MTLAQAAAQVQSAIDFGTIAAQQAATGDPIFAALSDAQEALTWINAQIPMFQDDGPALPNVSAKVNQVVGAVYDAAANLRTSSDVPTLFTPAPSTTWAWALGGIAALAGVWFMFRPRGIA